MSLDEKSATQETEESVERVCVFVIESVCVRMCV